MTNPTARSRGLRSNLTERMFDVQEEDGFFCQGARRREQTPRFAPRVEPALISGHKWVYPATIGSIVGNQP
jgi:hypothetical protein